MRTFTASLIFGLTVLATPLVPAFAAGEVLVPTDSGSSSSQPNYGLVPAASSVNTTDDVTPSAPKTQATTQAATQATTRAPAGVSVSTAPAPTPIMKVAVPAGVSASTVITPGPGTNGSPAPTAPWDPTGSNQPPSTITLTPQQTAALKNRLNQPDQPSTFITGYADASTPSAAPLPNAVAVSSNYNWNAFNENIVFTRLGIAVSQVPSLCTIQKTVVAAGDAGMGQVNLSTSNSGTVRYGGNLKALVATVKAVCSSNITVPANNGLFTKTDGSYVVILGAASCQSSGNAKSVMVSANAAGQPMCTLQ